MKLLLLLFRLWWGKRLEFGRPLGFRALTDLFPRRCRIEIATKEMSERETRRVTRRTDRNACESCRGSYTTRLRSSSYRSSV